MQSSAKIEPRYAMMRKLVILALVVCPLMVLCFCIGFATHKYRLSPQWLRNMVARTIAGNSAPGNGGPPGLWAEFLSPDDLAWEQQKLVEELDAIGYLGASRPAPKTEGVTIHDRERAYPGFNLYSSGHTEGAYLLDLEGNILHEWHHDARKIWPTFTFSNVGRLAPWWRRVHLYENGDLLAIYEGVGIVKLDKDSNLLWKARCNAHHEQFVHADGSISVLTRKSGLVPRINTTRPVLEDFLTVLSPDGEIVREISLLDCLENSLYAPILRQGELSGDIFHTNTLHYIDGSLAGRSPIFRKGNFLISMRTIDTIAIIDPNAEKVVWAISGMWLRQHDPTLLRNGNILLFDNVGNEGRSKVVEFDPFTQEVAWVYGTAPGESLFSLDCGASKRLPNGNTLITESSNGRALEVTQDGQIVWEYINPHRAGAEGKLIAYLSEVKRLPISFPVHWARGHAVH